MQSVYQNSVFPRKSETETTEIVESCNRGGDTAAVSGEGKNL